MNINDKFRLVFYSGGVYISTPTNKAKKLNLDSSIMDLRNEYSRLNYKNNYTGLHRLSKFLCCGGWQVSCLMNKTSKGQS